jgi:hypothetical protein
MLKIIDLEDIHDTRYLDNLLSYIRKFFDIFHTDSLNLNAGQKKNVFLRRKQIVIPFVK